MLRLLIIVLLAANGLYFAWAQGYLAVAGLTPPSAARPVTEAASEASAGAHAPIHPDAVALVDSAAVDARRTAAAPVAEPPAIVVAQQTALPEPEPLEPLTSPEDQNEPVAPDDPPPEPAAQPAVEPAPAPRQCMAVGPFSEEQMAPMRAALQTWPQGHWRLSQSTQAGRWMVFWGGVNDELVISARLAELQAKQIAYERLRNSPVGAGFSLGRFSTEAAAEQQKRNMEQRGVLGTDVVVEREAATLYTIEFPDFAAARDRIQRDLSRHLGARPLQAC